jgi:hypothetical protein
MTDADRFRHRAKDCREQAILLQDPKAVAQWLKIAEEYDKLAEAAAALGRGTTDS